MMDLLEACDVARDRLRKQGYKNGLCEICDLGDKWLFFGRTFDKGIVDYGNCPVTVDKETGQYENFPISIMENYDLYYKSKDIEVPPEYVIKD